jgi:hypothetical protein
VTTSLLLQNGGSGRQLQSLPDASAEKWKGDWMSTHRNIPLIAVTMIWAGLLGLLGVPAFADDASEPDAQDLAVRASGAEAGSRLESEGWVIDKLELSGIGKPGVRKLYVLGRIRVTAQAAWNAIAYSNDDDWPGLKEAAIERQNGDSLFGRYAISVPVFRDRRYRLVTVNKDSSMTETFWKIPGYGNVNTIDGRWQVAPISASECSVEYILCTDPGMKLIPGFIINWATKRAVPGLFEHVYRAANKDAARLESNPR